MYSPPLSLHASLPIFAPPGTDGSALLHEAAERRHARAGPDHDDVARGVGGQAEAFVALDVDRQRGAFLAGRQLVRGHAPARVATGRGVLEVGDGQVDFLADRKSTRLNSSH